MAAASETRFDPNAPEFIPGGAIQENTGFVREAFRHVNPMVMVPVPGPLYVFIPAGFALQGLPVVLIPHPWPNHRPLPLPSMPMPSRDAVSESASLDSSLSSPLYRYSSSSDTFSALSSDTESPMRMQFEMTPKAGTEPPRLTLPPPLLAELEKVRLFEEFKKANPIIQEMLDDPRIALAVLTPNETEQDAIPVSLVDSYWWFQAVLRKALVPDEPLEYESLLPQTVWRSINFQDDSVTIAQTPND